MLLNCTINSKINDTPKDVYLPVMHSRHPKMHKAIDSKLLILSFE